MSHDALLFYPFAYRAGRLHCDGVSADDLAARYGTPLYVYAGRGIDGRFNAVSSAFAPFNPEIRYAAKACGNVHVLRRLVGLGAGVDVVSGGELERAWLAGCPMERVAFAGVGKSAEEIRAALDGAHSPLRGRVAGDPATRGTVGLINIESVGELELVDSIARELGRPVDVALRVNPDIDAGTHPYTSTGGKHNKFGIAAAEAEAVFEQWSRRPPGGARCVGLHAHIGSQILDPAPFARAAEALVAAAARLRAAGARVDLLDIGGGWPNAYRPEQVRDLAEFSRAVAPALAPEVARGARIVVEPGRAVIANAAVLLTRVRYLKHAPGRRFVITDAGMQTLLRPALYGAEHPVWPVSAQAGPFDSPEAACVEPPADVVGPICETGDFLALGRPLPAVAPGDLLAVFGVGAYGMVMASTYNQHPRPAEVLVDLDRHRLIRPRETVADLVGPEIGLDADDADTLG